MVACVSATGGPTLAQVLQGPEFADRELTIVAFDDLQDVLDAIEAGIIYATMVQRPVQMGKLSISESNRILTEGYVPECACSTPASPLLPPTTSPPTPNRHVPPAEGGTLPATAPGRPTVTTDPRSGGTMTASRTRFDPVHIRRS